MKKAGAATANTIQIKGKRVLELNLDDIDAVIFDMDGVITDTALIHAVSWKKMFDDYLKDRSIERRELFKPFNIDPDYYRYIDGKPRFDGVKSFLESRGIDVPLGNPDDLEENTIYGLGNRKNQYFLQLLKKEKIKVYQSSVDLVKNLKEHGVKVGIITSSRNANEILESAEILVLFDVKVDGLDSAKLGLKGKPEPDIFIEAARKLNVSPERSAIFEDSLSGVKAGEKGGFGLVIGVDRVGQEEELRQNGADAVVHDLSQIVISKRLKPLVKKQKIQELPSAIESETAIFEKLRKGTPIISLDYDGTLTPIVVNPEEAILSEKARRIIRRLAEQWTVAIISGRDLQNVRKMVGVSDIIYAGSHGFDIAGPGGSYRSPGDMEKYLPLLDKAEKELYPAIEGIPGARVERKRFSIAVHFREVSEDRIPEVEKKIKQVLERQSGLRLTTGKKILEFRPDIDWDKGKALLSLYESLYVDRSNIVPLFIGDDDTDEDAFKAIGTTGISIFVGENGRETNAHYTLRNPEEVIVFLEDLAAFAEREISRGIWVLAYEGFNPEQEGLREALCTTGNGYFATRGAAPESHASDIHYPGTYIAGIYNRLKTKIAGQVLENESLVNVPNWLPLSFCIEDGNWFDVQQVELKEYRQELDLRRGILSRLIRFSDSQGRQTRVFQRRFVHMGDKHAAGMETTITAENWSGTLNIRSALDGQVTNSGVARYSQLNNKHLLPVEAREINDDTIYLQVQTNQSKIYISETARTRIMSNGERLDIKPQVIKKPGYIGQEFAVHLNEGQAITVEKIVYVYTSRDTGISESGLESQKNIERAPDMDKLLESHIQEWDHIWRRCRITIEAKERTAMVLHLHIFHLLQTVSPNTIDLDVGVPPRGLHGEAYRAHILWDELFIFPFLNFRIPDITRSLLMYRYRRLPEARWLAKQAGYAGAMYPWQSGSDGREESQTLHLNPRSGRWIPDNSWLQKHVNIAIAYNIWLYYQVTGDLTFLAYYGAEMFIEIARFWASMSTYNRSLDRYEIHKVMGPDEYHDAYPDAKEPGINNNAYTNIMAVWVMCRAIKMLDLLPESRKEILLEDLNLTREEINRWEDISRKMRVVFHEDGIISQFEGYDKLLEFDWEGYKKKYGNIERLDRILELEGDTTNRYKVSKQADVLMLFYLLSADELRGLFARLNYPFKYETIPQNIEYYLKRTAHGSTLSRIVHSWVLARSRRELSWHLFKDALESDVSDIQGGTTPEGIHLGAMAGTVDLIQRCYTGIETWGDKLWLNPSLPDELKELKFDILYRQQWINLWVNCTYLRIYSRNYTAGPVKIVFKGREITLRPGSSLELELGESRENE